LCARYAAAGTGAGLYIAAKALYKWTKSSVSGQEIELFYWPARGRGEQIRLVLAEAGVTWSQPSFNMTDEAAKLAYFAKCRELGGNATTNIPMLKIDGHYLTQSHAVLKYAARKFGLYPAGDDVYACYLVDNLIAAAEDLRGENYKPMPMFGGGEEQKRHYIDAVLPKHLGNASRLLGEQQYLAGTFSVADITWYDVLDVASRQVPGVLDAYPTLKALHARVGARPNIAAWLASEQSKSSFAFPAL